MRPSKKQADVLYFNANLLNLPYEKEAWLRGRAYETDFAPDALHDLVGSVLELIRAETAEPAMRNQLFIDRQREIINQICDSYMNEYGKKP